MGMRAVAHIITGQTRAAFYAQWGSAQYKIPALTDWITDCVDHGQMPDATTYLEQTRGSAFDHFTETRRFEAALPGDLDWYYRLTIEPDDRDEALPWAGSLRVWGPNLWTQRISTGTIEDVVAADQPYEAEFSADDLDDLHDVAARGAREVLATLDHHGPLKPGEREWWTYVAAVNGAA